MVVGGVGTDGNLWARSKTDPDENIQVIKVYAPCYDITVPNAISGGYRAPTTVTGVSYGRHCHSLLSLFQGASMNNVLTSATLAAGTISGLATYFLGLSSLSSVLIADDPVRRVKNLKDELEIGSPIPRGPNEKVKSLYNLADPRTCPPDPPPGFKDGDEVPCRDTIPTSGNTVVATPNRFITT